MKISVALGVLFVAALAINVHAQGPALAIIEDWPYCPCLSAPVAYHLDPTVTFKGNNTYCFRVIVNPPLGCTTKCCTKIDLKKLELNAKPACRVSGLPLKGFINGQPSATAPTIERSAQGPAGTFILKLTQLGLNLTTADGTEICIQLALNRNGQGCDTLEELCVPPPGAPNGVCQTALFDSQNDCCGLTDVGGKLPPPPSSPRPSPVKPCKACTYVNMIPPAFDPFPARFDAATCALLGSAIIGDINAAAAAEGAVITKPFQIVSCDGLLIKICGEFASDADGAKLQDMVSDGIASWLSIISPAGSFPPYLWGYTVIITVGGDGSDPLLPPSSCLEGMGSVAAEPTPIIDFPKCACNTKKYSTPFAVSPYITQKPGINGTRYCFDVKVITPQRGGSCATQTVLSKIEFWANDLTRRKILNFYVKPAVGATTYSVVAPSWGAYGEETLKCTGLNWSLAQADGAEVCMELKTGTKLGAFCLGNAGNTDYCWSNVFNPEKTCCPTSAGGLV